MSGRIAEAARAASVRSSYGYELCGRFAYLGEFGDVHSLVDLAVAAETHGWDGVHLWDHVLYHEAGWPVASPVVAAAAIAAATSRLRIVLTVTLPRRQVQDVAQDTAGIDALSGRRLTVLATIGSMDREYSEFGLDADLRARGRALDERLRRLVELWSPPRLIGSMLSGLVPEAALAARGR